ncbi:GlsB/YeaQ/YmgE family stress response membrane protein [Sphaerisporangium corydalis]|uniref:GlsB/YeaQ/YmgE family stress response membrane protein n=1 Tax=Sphaerisporangium corydalis TaxID=1441875 RepID=A0ABV9ETC6_9ACTN|nr:GlsB/YeaQ/YmgE family stress response membrane protein [Sphaerisporangium corydalis]
MITFIISAIIVGAITGGLGRLLIPGRQDIGWVATILAGIVAALVGTGIAHLLKFADRTWIVLVVQLVLAVVCVGVVSGLQGKKAGRA